MHRLLLAHPRVQLHFTPTCSSWISQVERWFAELQRRCLDRGVFCSLDELTTALEDWIKTWNATARPFRWTKTADQIIDRICRYCSRISGPAHQGPLVRASATMSQPAVLLAHGGRHAIRIPAIRRDNPKSATNSVPVNLPRTARVAASAH